MADLERIAATLEAIVDTLRDADHLDPFNGTVRWRYKSEKYPSHNDALATLEDLFDCTLDLTESAKNGNDIPGGIFVSVHGTQGIDGSPGSYWHRSLKSMLVEFMKRYEDDDNREASQYKTAKRLLAALKEPK